MGGLLVLVLSMQESERVANQLRGRAGRQGDPGETFTLVDLNDPLVEASGLTAGVEAMRPFLHSAFFLLFTCSFVRYIVIMLFSGCECGCKQGASN